MLKDTLRSIDGNGRACVDCKHAIAIPTFDLPNQVDLICAKTRREQNGGLFYEFCEETRLNTTIVESCGEVGRWFTQKI